MTFPSAARRCRLLVIVCALLVFWTGFDSQVLLLASAGGPSPVSQPPPTSQQDSDDDDDYVLDLNGKPALGRRLERNPRPPSPRLHPPIADPKPCFSFCRLGLLPTTPVCEPERRNGIGAPLLC